VAFQDALPGSRGEAYLQQRGIPLALAQQYGVGYAAPGTWPHAARDWRGGRVIFPHTTPDGRLVNPTFRTTALIVVNIHRENPTLNTPGLPGDVLRMALLFRMVWHSVICGLPPTLFLPEKIRQLLLEGLGPCGQGRMTIA
jgi:hypothetical protein